MTFLEKLEALRVRKGLSERGLAQRVGFDQSSISRWRERGTRPRPDLAKRLADFFAIPVEDLTDDRRDIPGSLTPADHPEDQMLGGQRLPGQSAAEWLHQEFTRRVSPDDPLFAQLEEMVQERFGDQVRELDAKADELRKQSDRLEAAAGRIDATLQKLDRIVSKYGLSQADAQRMIREELAKGGDFAVTQDPRAKGRGRQPDLHP